ncbi:TPA: hypothetical protein DCZ46_01105 [Candidatus Campbellbacteria bacterium]|nr:MAG: hypothetical protein UR74_C0001G0173 [Candidatus Campbellbacteria bacterium GW2011_GWD2_35_24]KKP76122.1 MAG: hypothetical protein UR75_C0001G0156 [Candidatus Campbellbacteria bacterium GW2011_GWC2_35_28]KKP77311.1 MAG: hypothetical protein UR76_C0001G0156 [Candidatus Campbellbacteria bacterium GW2011_GWC1_35_31]KKP79240.1 MAG: hypothetical protein UR79_C0001G0156 [Candidatus Campbellbacteria bacterium GW2011_GWD1_35_49]HBC70546.1 hypothetical protein [Candidatus Campbellbacteria bacter
MAFVLWGLCIFLAWFSVKKILEKYFKDCFPWFTFSKESFNYLIKDKKINHFQVLFLTVVVVGLSPFYYEYPNWGLSYVASQKADGIIVKYPIGKFCLDNKDCFNIPSTELIGFSSVSPVTSNPKIRPLKYSVKIIIVDEKKFVTEIPEAKEGKFTQYFENGNFPGASVSVVTNLAKYHLLEFNEANSKKISEFYNYLDSKQQADFKKLVEGWVNPRLAKSGLSIKCNDFMIVEL